MSAIHGAEWMITILLPYSSTVCALTFLDPLQKTNFIYILRDRTRLRQLLNLVVLNGTAVLAYEQLMMCF
jgi:hypothetical protein